MLGFETAAPASTVALKVRFIVADVAKFAIVHSKPLPDVGVASSTTTPGGRLADADPIT